MRKILIKICMLSIRAFLKLLYLVLVKRPDGILNIQRFNTGVHSFALLLMDYGGSGDFRDSGEEIAMDYVVKRLKQKQPNDKLIVFDVGANVGGYSLDLTNKSGDSVLIHAFEPIESTYKTLCDNTWEKHNIFAHNIGLSDASGIIPVYTTKEDCSVHSSIYQQEKCSFDLNLTEVKECKFDTVDGFCDDNGIKHIHFLKIDVEGHEFAVLKGSKQILDRGDIDFIQFEFGPGTMDSKSYFRDFWYLLSDKYDIYRIVSGGIVPIRKYKEQMEIFIFSNYLAAKKS